jgi:hypothetical protein
MPQKALPLQIGDGTAQHASRCHPHTLNQYRENDRFIMEIPIAERGLHEP